MIEVSNISKSYGSSQILKSISFTIQAKGIVALLGPNGAGKTTLVRTLVGYLDPTEGEVLVCGRRSSSQAAKSRMGYALETPPLYQELTVREYLRCIGGFRGIAGPALPLSVDAVVKLCHLKNYQHHLCAHLSKGLRQRVNLAQAIIHRPDVVLLDEPASGLDLAQVSHFNSILSKLQTRSTILLSTHLLSHIPKECERALIVNEGKLEADVSFNDYRELEQVYFEVISGTSEQQQEQEVVHL